ncbi:MAG: MFS transporter [Thermoleophilia bacterium]|jgi:DHA1 family quinolone resistance protein-like MFS transporter
MFKQLKKLHWSIFALSFSSAVLMTGFMMLIPLLPRYADQLGFNEYEVGLIVAAFFIGRVLFQFPLGVLSDHIGRRWIMSAALLMFAITTIAYALTTNAAIMVTLRILQGVASSGFVVGSQSYINDRTPVELRGLANGVMSSAINIGVIAGPLLGGTLSQIYSIQTPFLIGGLLGGACFLLSLWIPGIQLKRKQNKAADMRWKSRARQILSSVMRLPAFSLSLIQFFQMMGVGIFITAAPILTAEFLDWGASQIAIAFAASGVSAAILSPSLGQLADRVGRIWVMALGLLVMALESLVVMIHPGTTLTILAFAVGGAGAPAYFNAFYSLIGDITRPHERGGVTGFIGSFGEWGSIIGSSLLTPFIWHNSGIKAAMTLDVGVFLLTLLVSVGIRSQMKRVQGNDDAAC